MHADWHPGEPDSPAETEDDVPAAAPEHPHAATMHAWFSGVGKVRDALIAGDRNAIATQAEALAATLEEGAFPDAWQASVDDLRDHARATATAESLDAAAIQVAQMADDCGGCHDALDVVDLVEDALPPDDDVPEGTSTAEIMARHGFGATRMWEGMVAPSSRRWIRGTTMFVITPNCLETEPKRGTPCARTHALARRAHLVDDRAARTELYGQLLATCADCHAAARPASP